MIHMLGTWWLFLLWFWQGMSERNDAHITVFSAVSACSSAGRFLYLHVASFEMLEMHIRVHISWTNLHIKLYHLLELCLEHFLTDKYIL